MEKNISNVKVFLNWYIDMDRRPVEIKETITLDQFKSLWDYVMDDTDDPELTHLGDKWKKYNAIMGLLTQSNYIRSTFMGAAGKYFSNSSKTLTPLTQLIFKDQLVFTKVYNYTNESKLCVFAFSLKSPSHAAYLVEECRRSHQNNLIS